MGDELQFMQFGGIPKDVKPLKGVESGVFEIVIRYDTDLIQQRYNDARELAQND